ncbi:hypothetical protein [Cohnella zeiphila]|uniref:hypothetical protein n=1 Tax=Cohnella zeiphila TaxID=2761120 RepID=UPI00308072F1
MHKANECGILKLILLEEVIRLKKKNKPISFDELLKELQGAKSSEGEQRQVALEELFNEAFMSRCSSLKSFEEFLHKGNFTAKTQEDLNNIPDELMDRHVDRETHFTNWKAMLDQATAEYNG